MGTSVGMMTGRCLCGSVKFTAAKVEIDHHVCHCGMCRRWSGGAGFFGARAMDVTFAHDEELAVYASSNWAARGFCKACGTPLYYFLKPTGAYMMNVGTFDDPAQFRLVREIFIDKKPPGFDFAGDHERWTEKETFDRLTPRDA
jgi:hypothetical protein